MKKELMYPLVTQLNFLPILSKEKLAQVRNLMSPQRLQMYRSFPRVRSSSGKRRRPLIKDILSETRRVGFIWKHSSRFRSVRPQGCIARREQKPIYYIEWWRLQSLLEASFPLHVAWILPSWWSHLLWSRQKAGVLMRRRRDGGVVLM